MVENRIGNAEPVNMQVGSVNVTFIDMQINKKIPFTSHENFFEKGVKINDGDDYSQVAIGVTSIGKNNNDIVFKLKMIVKGDFIFTSKDKKKSEMALEVEAPKVLMSFLRSSVITVCAVSGIAPIIIGSPNLSQAQNTILLD